MSTGSEQSTNEKAGIATPAIVAVRSQRAWGRLRWHWKVFLIAAVGLLSLVCATQWQLESFAESGDGIDQVALSVAKPVVYDRYGKRLSYTYENPWNVHDQLPLEEVPLFLQQAILVAEDQRFYQHRGPDWRARSHAVWQNLLALRVVRGASTISEQVVRMLRPRPRTLWSRWLEGWEAGALEQDSGKTDILEFYVNQVPYAARRRGVALAARYYFGRDIDTLNRKEMLALAVMVRSPSGLSPLRPNPRLEKAIATLAERMQGRGLVTPKQKQRLLAQSLLEEFAPATKATNGFQAGFDAAASVEQGQQGEQQPLDSSHFVRHVQSQYQLYEATHFVAHAAPVIHSSLDTQLQHSIQRMVDTRLARLAGKKVGSAGVLVVDHCSNEVLSWVVSHVGQAKQRFNQIDTVRVPRQPGSALKPFLYALALQKGWHAATLIDDSPTQARVGQGLHEYHNYSHRYYGLIPLREALGNSLNIPAIKTVDYVGTENYLGFLRRVGIHSLDDHPHVYGDGIALGNGEISLFELVQAYTTLARQGHFVALKVLQDRAVAGAGANGRLPPKSACFSYQAEGTSQVMDATAASLIADILADPGARDKEFGRHSILNLPYQTAVKTGTSSDYRDAWALGFNDRFTVGVWMGNMDYQPMVEVTGSTGPATVLRSVFHQLNKNRDVQVLALDQDLRRIRICRDTGRMVGEDSEYQSCEMRDELFSIEQLAALKQPSIHTDARAAGPVKNGSDIDSDESVRLTRELTSGPRISKPSQGLNIALDPRIPDASEYFEFELSGIGKIKRVDWYVNNEFLSTTTAGRLQWQVARGIFETYAVVWQQQNELPLRTSTVTYRVH